VLKDPQTDIHTYQVCPKYTTKSETEESFAAATIKQTIHYRVTAPPPAVTILQHTHRHATTLFLWCKIYLQRLIDAQVFRVASYLQPVISLSKPSRCVTISMYTLISVVHKNLH
jgi:hypothetical protein